MLPLLSTARPALAAFAVLGVVWGTYAAVLPDLKAMLGVDEGQLGMLIFCTPIAAMAGMLAAPWIGARLGRVALPLAVGAMALAIALPGQAAWIVLFPVAMMIFGAATGLSDILMNARVTTMEAARGLPLMNLAHAAYSFGYAGAAMMTGVLRGADMSPGAVTGTMALVALGLTLVTLERDGTIHGLQRPKDGSAGSLGWVPVVGGGIVLIAYLTENAAESWSALHIEQTLGGSPTEGSMGPAALALTMGFARLVGQGFATRVDPVRLMCGGAMISATGALTAAFATTPAMAYVGFIIMGIGSSVVAPTAFSLVGRFAEPAARARAVARATLLGYFGYFFGPPLLGMIAGGFGLPMAFVFAAVMLLTVPVLAPILTRVSQEAKVAR